MLSLSRSTSRTDTRSPAARSLRGFRRTVLGATLAVLAAGCGAGAAGAVLYRIDPAHSSAAFKVRHIFTQIPGRFSDVAGQIEYNESDPLKSTVEIVIQAASVDTDNDRRDNHLRSDDFFGAEKYPILVFKSTKIEETDRKNVYTVTGDLTIRDVTKPVLLTVEALGFDDGGRGGERVGFLATGTINRPDYGISWNRTLDNGGVLLGDDVRIEFPVEAVRQKTAEG